MAEGFLLLMAASLAVLADRLLGEPRRWHPLVGFGRLSRWIEARCRLSNVLPRHDRLLGVAAWGLAVLPPLMASMLLCQLPWGLGWLVSAACLYFALGARSLEQHVGVVETALLGGDLPGARLAVGCIVSRDSTGLDAPATVRAALETTLENGNDAVFAALFWFALLGGPGAVLYRLTNTLDAMWGYKSERYLHFGWAAARFDDVLNWLPARLTALTYALLGNTRQALDCWRRQASAWESPNAGPVMAAGAGSLGLVLGGAASYEGCMEPRPTLGMGAAPEAKDIQRGLALVRRGLMLWLLLWGLGVMVAGAVL
ncbi:adenosylcobinamide-phosphate synthase CbiB [Denitratisoma oestradiolicum]|uniref:Cobalamin biosynthesis protein CobD n=1 Tax=Denitratisoma oestradiolicum TaxID=311182 RepID=A0A6S6XXH9_9PROT|nr:adenosylcobinamide-phosphate synthase CbiB [Denitratisoma oestradiolicum]TWO79918.1 cobalamin biosynthesis protein [Denitratisoma oestradiolicum]CAB1369674.1 Cobalamin biosynthesis protein CobD [Denitratisoma oestradiolicum]